MSITIKTPEELELMRIAGRLAGALPPDTDRCPRSALADDLSVISRHERQLRSVTGHRTSGTV